MGVVRIFLVSLLLLAAAYGPCEDIELSSVLKSLDATLEWNPSREIGVMLVENNRIAFKTGVPMALIDYKEKVDIDPPVRKQDGAIYFTAQAVDAIRDALIRSRFRKKEEGFKVSTILLDPGHGGEDPGAVDEVTVSGKKVQIKEKDVVLAISRHLSRMLREEYADKSVLFTRSSDRYVSLEQRAETANELLKKNEDSILYVSIHANRTAFNKKAAGFEVWYLPPEVKRTLLDGGESGAKNVDILPILNLMLEEEISVESIVLAREILSGIDAKIGKVTANRGLKEESWYVVRNAKMPAVLVEVGFISNTEEAKRLMDDSYLKDIAEGIYNGIRSFISRFERIGSSRDR
jgi:N-acetylmuramoyl-L-alanine amidase